MFKKILLTILAGPFLACAMDFDVQNAAEFKAALPKLFPGDSLILENGTYDLGKVTVTNQATAEQSITIRAKNRDRATITGKTVFSFEQAAHITLSGLNLETDDIGPVLILGSHHIRVTRCVFRVHESPLELGALIRWILIMGASEKGSKDLTINSHHNRIDHKPANRIQNAQIL